MRSCTRADDARIKRLFGSHQAAPHSYSALLSKTLILGVLIVMIVRQDRSYWYDGRLRDQMVYVKAEFAWLVQAVS